MKDAEFQRVLAAMPRGRRRVFDVIRNCPQPVTQRDLHRLLAKTSRKVKFTDMLTPLARAGLIRAAGQKRDGGRAAATLWEATPLPAIERERARYAADHSGPSHSERIADLRRMERGDFGDWYRARRRVVELSQLMTEIEPMTFWEAAPDEDLTLVDEELAQLEAWVRRVRDARVARQEDDATRTKIAQLRETDGRTPSEAEAFRRKADWLEATL
jgi:hypothetical protein